ncbi:MAG: PSD1 and planctomycete cytochrome C domain-containing protein [Deltaproteobacteria bacterium]|nr:PSD1 and planctomycete cytochrome C domain-containing protein [Deltaproteobacteria bacterium]
MTTRPRSKVTPNDAAGICRVACNRIQTNIALAMCRQTLALGLLWAAVLFAPCVAMGAPPDDVPRFNRDIRPILSDKCFFCHGPDSAKRKAGLRLDVRDAALKDEAIVPGKPEASELWKRINATDVDDVMPPPDVHKALKPEEITLLRRWIEAGAEYEPHWAYVPLTRPRVPAKAKSAIDAFIQDRLAKAKLAPSPAADRRTLLRRLSLDLTGLPPTPEQLRAFEADKTPNAVERQIDRLLRSPHYGERMAVPWLDVVRFADTVGYHGDQNQNVFPYRDYVVNAFNTNKRFDQFTLEQVAGDLLPRPTEKQRVASAFNRLNMVTREGGAQPGEYLAKYMADRVRAIGTAWLGSTIGCAQCHDHKYDPINAQDFYSMGAFFSDIREWGVYADYPYTPNPDLKGVGNEDPFAPEIMVRNAFLVERAKVLQQRLADTQKQLVRQTMEAKRSAFNAWLANTRTFIKQHPDGWLPLSPTVAAEGKLEARVENQIVVLHNTKKLDAWDVPGVSATITNLQGPLASLRLDLIPHSEHNGSHLRSDRTQARVYFSAKIVRGDSEIKLAFDAAQANVAAPVFRNGHQLPDNKEEWRTPPGYARDRVSAVWQLAQPQELQPTDKLVIRVGSESVGAFTLSMSPLASTGARHAPPPFGNDDGLPDPNRLPSATARFVANTTNTQALQEVFAFSGAAAAAAPELLTQLHQQRRQWLSVKDGKAPLVVTVPQKPRVTRILPRGNWQDESGPIVTPAVLHFLPGLPPTATAHGRRPTRLDLARWLTSRENPLTARAFMNRLWKQFFGTGLSAVLDDLGGQGEPPSHPELLDWLAVEFIESGWDVKHMVKLLVMSNTYQQDSTARPELMAVDPLNRLLARQSQRRLDAEFVRDNALFIAGLLNEQRGGPSVFPYQPEGYYDNIEFPQRKYITETDEQQFRRGLYMHWQRTFLHPMLANFDAPSREECTADRPLSNTPQQALTLLNDPTFVQAAQSLAVRLLRAHVSDDSQRIKLGFELATGHPPSGDQAQALLAHLRAQQAHYEAHAQDAAKAAGPVLPLGATTATTAAWSSVCRVLLNVYETVTRI